MLDTYTCHLDENTLLDLQDATDFAFEYGEDF